MIVLCLSTMQETQCHRKPSNNAPAPKPNYEQMSSTSFTLRDAADRLSIMTRCPQRLWPDYSWSNFQVVFIDKDTGKALLWNDQAKLDQGPQPAISEIDSEDDLLKAAPSSGRFWTRMYRGARTIVMWRYATDTESALIGLTFHEGFHAVGQHSFQKVRFERGDNYPEDWHPRYIRRKLLESLMYFLLTGEQEQLHASAFWYQRWTRQFPDDVNRVKGVDMIEGTAEFVGEVGAFLAFAGCEATNDSLLGWAKERIRNPALGLDTISVDDESYDLGVISGIILLERNAPNWQAQVEQGRGIEDILLDGVAPIPQPEDEELAQKVKAVYDKRNSANGVGIERFISELNSDSVYVLSLPKRFLVGSYLSGGFVNSKVNNTSVQIVKNFTGQFRGTSGSIEVKDQYVGFLALIGAESGDYVFFPLPKEELTKEVDGSYSIVKDEHIDGLNLQLDRFSIRGFNQDWLILR
jgi:hypothetical protein